jgi:uncharacterized protein (DUF1501 family)
MKRRQFIQTSSIMTLPVLLKGMEVSAIQSSKLAELIGPENDKILVLIQLNGGNDGLNTLIPLDRYDNLMKARQDIIQPVNNVLKLTEKDALHHRLTTFQNLYKEGDLSIVQAVSYPNQNRSHFRSTDIWMSASDSTEYITTGWLGRNFETDHPRYPYGYPNTEYPDPFAITMGSVVSETCQGTVTSFSYTMNNRTDLRIIPPTETSSDDIKTNYGYELAYMNSAFNQSNEYASRVGDTFDKSINKATYPNTTLSNQLKNVARLIAGGLQTKIYLVSIGGFDTHASQVNGTDVLTGAHANLMDNLSSSIGAFQSDLKLLGIDKRVIGMTFSEFGRQIKSNNSFGTDHGTAAPLFVFGSCVKGGIIGESPIIRDNVAQGEGVAMQYDFRSVYSSILVDWFKIDKSKVKQVLFKDFQHLPLIEGCEITNLNEDENLIIQAHVFPNPASDYVNLEFTSKGSERTSIAIFDSIGSLIKVVFDKRLDSGDQKVTIPVSDFMAGIYYIRIAEGAKVKTVNLLIAG